MTIHEVAQTDNEQAYDMLRGIPHDDYDRLVAVWSHIQQTLRVYLAAGPRVGDKVYSSDGPMIVVDVQQGDVLLTADGGWAYRTAWHDGPYDMDGAVYYEAYSNLGRVAHGYVHPETRRIAQVG